MLGKLTVPGRPTYLENGTCRARAYCACSDSGGGGGGGGVWTFFLSSIFSLPGDARYRPKYCLKGPLNPEQQTNLNKVVKIQCTFEEPYSFCRFCLYCIS